MSILKTGENAALITEEGEFLAGWTTSPRALHENADAVQELMIEMLKDPDCQEGMWLWKISDNWTTVEGCELEDDLE